jgi:uncharacterized membrane protein
MSGGAADENGRRARVVGRLGFALRQIAYDLRVGSWLRPSAVVAVCALLAPLTTELEIRLGGPGGALEGRLSGDPAATSVILGTVAGSMMTIVSIVYSILLMVLSLASMQFSPRILGSFLQDRVSQTTLGIFVGTFAYALLALRRVAQSPTLTVYVALTLAFGSVAFLLFFIHHIGKNMQANHIVRRLCDESLAVVQAEWPALDGAASATEEALPPVPAAAVAVGAPTSGYVQLVDVDGLVAMAHERGIRIWVERIPGEFAVLGTPLARLAPPEACTAEVIEACAAAFDLGELRTKQQDVEFGLRQLVDVALKAISPAVNDPSTAATCVDHLAVILCELARRRPPPRVWRDDAGEPMVTLPWPTFVDAVDLAFNQIRQYGSADMAVTLRMLRALDDAAQATNDPQRRARLWHHATLIDARARTSFHEADQVELRARLDQLRRRCSPDAAPIAAQ